MADEDRTRWRDRLETSGRVDDVAGDHALALSADGDRGLAGNDAGSELDAARDVDLEAPNGVDEVEGGPDGALGVVLAGCRCAPDCHDRVADELLDRAAVAVHDLAGGLVVARQDLAGVFGVSRLGHLRGVDEVREQDRDETSFGGRTDGCVFPVGLGLCCVRNARSRAGG